jgi:GLPGLI family protein
MKKILLVASGFLAASVSYSQVKEGMIVYERKLNMHKRLTGEQESMKNMVPEFSTFKLQLVFNNQESIFKQIEEGQDIREQADDGPEQRLIIRDGSNNQTYKNYSTGKTIELRELGPKKYIIEDSIRMHQWKLDEAATRFVKGFSCKKATTRDLRGSEVVAWYTDQILCPSGPESFGGLPGMILELNINDNEIVFSAIEISNASDQKLVKAPDNGKKITRKDFQKMMEQEFGPDSGGGPVIRIRRN